MELFRRSDIGARSCISESVGGPHPRWAVPLGAAIATAGAAVLLFYWREARALWVDEEMLALNVRDRSFRSLAGPLWLGQAAPLGWLVLERAAMLTLGLSERAIRALPVLFGLATLSTCVLIARRWFRTAGMVVLTLLLSFGTHIWFFSLELKQYSADTWGGLLLPALAAWAIASADRRMTTRRIDIWWITAAFAQWFSLGALFVAPGCGAVLASLAWRRYGRPAACRSVALSALWAASASAHYYVSLRYASGSAYLREYWATAFPPASAALPEIADWLVTQLGSLADNPGGTEHALLFWLVVVVGLVTAARSGSLLALMFAMTVPVAVMLVVLHLVPLSGRLSLWIAPALYAGVAFAADASVSAMRARHRGARAAGVVIGLAVGWLCVDIVNTGVANIRGRWSESAHGLDDRGAVRTLMSARRPGDAMIVTHLGLPAVWWYGGVDLSAPEAGSTFEDGGPIFEITQERAPDVCHPDDLRNALQGVRGATLYLGFEPGDHLEDLALSRLSELGAITRYQRFASIGHTAVVDLTAPPRGRFVRPGAANPDPLARPEGCVGIRQARRW